MHRLHHTYKVSRKTIFYVKEYGPHSNVVKTIIRESIKILLFSAIISSFGGLAVEQIKALFISIIPLLILLPTLNDLIGDYGTIIASRFSTMLHEGKIKEKWWINAELKKLYVQILIIALITSISSAAVALLISHVSHYTISSALAFKIFLAVILDVVLLISILFVISVLAGLYFFRKKEDPNNFLIPIITSVADFGNMLLLSAIVIALF